MMPMDNPIYDALALIIPLVIAIVFHEVSHGYVAKLLGDPTAYERKRLSLNPLRHVDPVGTVLLPGALALAGLPVFGWAKPVPVNAQRLRNPRYGMMAVAAAGPGSNLIMAGIGAVALGLVARTYAGVEPGAITAFTIANLTKFIQINIFLALFNLLPIPPFDGSHIVEGVLPRKAARAYAGLHRYAMPLLLVLLVALPSVAPQLDIVSRVLYPPFTWMLEDFGRLAAWAAGA